MQIIIKGPESKINKVSHILWDYTITLGIYRNTIFLTNHKLSSDFKKEILNFGVLDIQAHHFLHAHMKIKVKNCWIRSWRLEKKWIYIYNVAFLFLLIYCSKNEKNNMITSPQHWKMFLVFVSRKIVFFFKFFKSKLVFEKDNNQAMSKSRKLDTKTKAQSTVKHAWKKKLLTHFVFFKTELNLGQICG